MPCRCDTLKTVFGSDAPKDCGPCMKAKQREELRNTQHVQVDSDSGAYFSRLGVDVVRLSEDEQWCPGWAQTILDEFAYDGTKAKPVIERAALDQKFRVECQQIIDICTYGVWADDDKSAADRMTLHLKAHA